MQRVSGLFCHELPTRGFSITHAGIADRHDLLEVAATAYEEAYQESYPRHKRAVLFQEFGEKQAIYFIARLDGEAVGYAKMLMTQESTGEVSAYLDKLFFLQAHCRQGYGTALLERCIQEAIKHGANRMYLYVRVHNESAQKFYQKNGFAFSGLAVTLTVDGVEVSGADYVVMTCENLKHSLQLQARHKMR